MKLCTFFRGAAVTSVRVPLALLGVWQLTMTMLLEQCEDYYADHVTACSDTLATVALSSAEHSRTCPRHRIAV